MNVTYFGSPSCLGTTMATIVWTDNKKYVLGIRCIGNKLVWSLKSLQLSLDEDVKKIVLEKIKEYGFLPEHAFVWPLKGCKDMVDRPLYDPNSQA